MMKFRTIMIRENIKWFLILSLSMAFLSACDDEWDQHYNAEVPEVIDMRLADYIASNTDWSMFSQMLHQTGYDTVLNATQTYTVWVPQNAALTQIDMTDTLLVKQIVKGHIARFSIPTSGINSERIFMLGGKYATFTENSGTYKLIDCNLVSQNQLVQNGVVHAVDAYIPYISNIWEYIFETSGLDSLAGFIESQGGDVFNAYASTEIGQNSKGEIIYDSLFYYVNNVTRRVGDFNDEDSIYTVVLPTNSAWTKSYDNLKDLFLISENDGGVEAQELIINNLLVSNMAFKGFYDDPENADSLISTTSGIIHQPSQYFGYSSKAVLSNGYAFVSDSFLISREEAGLKNIVVEAENLADIDANKINCEITPKASYGTGFDISNNGYLDVTFTGSNFSGAAVDIPIPNTLSTKYDIYCVFVPFNIEGGDVKLKTKVKFFLTYENESGVEKELRLRPDVDETDTTALTKMYVGQFEFPVADVMSAKNVNAKVSLKIQNTLTDRTNKDGFSKNLRIDAIILEPVK